MGFVMGDVEAGSNPMTMILSDQVETTHVMRNQYRVHLAIRSNPHALEGLNTSEEFDITSQWVTFWIFSAIIWV